jgi:Holliday junction resolvase-like predicted endonuclease
MVYVKKLDWKQFHPDELHTSVKGAINELKVCAWLMEQGYEVFRNVSPTGKGDIIIWKNGEEPIIVDVKVGGKSKHPQVKTILVKESEFLWVD